MVPRCSLTGEPTKACCWLSEAMFPREVNHMDPTEIEGGSPWLFLFVYFFGGLLTAPNFAVSKPQAYKIIGVGCFFHPSCLCESCPNPLVLFKRQDGSCWVYCWVLVPFPSRPDVSPDVGPSWFGSPGGAEALTDEKGHFITGYKDCALPGPQRGRQLSMHQVMGPNADRTARSYEEPR